MAKVRAKKKAKKNIPAAIVHVHTTFNNTIITVTDLNGDTIVWSSAGALGFKGAKKSTPYAAQLVAQAIIKSAKEHGVKSIVLQIKGTGPGKSSTMRQFQASDIEVTEIKNVTPRPHNGVKKKKKYRRR